MFKPRYSKNDKNIDDKLGTRNLRPGPPAQLINKILDDMNNTEPTTVQKVNFFSFSAKITREIPWSQLSSIKINEFGSETSYFLEFLNSRLLILKTCSDLPLFYFGSLLARGYGIKCPKSRLIEYYDPEFSEMITNLERASHGDVGVHNKVLYEIKNHPFVIVYEFIPFINLFELGPNRAEYLFNDKNYKSRELMITIGKIICFDIFINNNKRLPFAWLNNGDPNNIGFKVLLDLLPPNAEYKSQKIIEIFIEDIYVFDSHPNILDPNDKVMLRNLGDYINSLGDFFKVLCYEFKSVVVNGKDIDSYEFHSFDKLKNMFINSTKYALTPKNLFHISMGILIMANEIIEADLAPLEELINYVSNQAIIKDWGDSYFKYSRTLKIEYFKFLVDFFRGIKEDNDLIFDWIDNNTFGIYQSPVKFNIQSIIADQMRLKADDEDIEGRSNEESRDGRKSKKSKKKKNKSKKKSGLQGGIAVDSNEEENEENESDEEDQEEDDDLVNQGEKKKKKKKQKDNEEDDENFERKGKKKLTKRKEKGREATNTVSESLESGELEGAKGNKNYEGKKNKRDFFNFNKKDNVIFKNDVHNGIYGLAEIGNDMIFGYVDRKYKEVEEKPPEPTDFKVKEEEKPEEKVEEEKKEEPKVVKPIKQYKDYNPEHTIYTKKQLEDKIKKEELFDTLQMKKKLNPEEAKYLEGKIKEVDEDFEADIKKDKEEEEEKNKKLIEANEGTKILESPDNYKKNKNKNLVKEDAKAESINTNKDVNNKQKDGSINTNENKENKDKLDSKSTENKNKAGSSTDNKKENGSGINFTSTESKNAGDSAKNIKKSAESGGNKVSNEEEEGEDEEEEGEGEEGEEEEGENNEDEK